jgi:spore coat polysaccharide biosynthesis protein SpsF (cytidylyltransferase family)
MTKSSTHAIIQARMTSGRLPGKVMEDLAGLPLLAWVVRAAREATCIGRVTVATTTNDSDDAVVAWATREHVDVFRGSEDDVLDRFHGAATDAEVVVRLTSDCPFLDPALIDDCIRARETHDADYACLGEETGFARGLDVEALRKRALDAAWSDATATHDRSHVTSFIYTHPDRFRLHMVKSSSPFSGRWTVDTPEDLAFVRAVAAHLPKDRAPRHREVSTVLAAHPDYADLNALVRQKTLEEG